MPRVHQGGPRVQIKNEMYLKNIRTNPILTLYMRSKFRSVLALVAEEFFLWGKIALCEGRLLKEAELQEYVGSCCAFLPFQIDLLTSIPPPKNKACYIHMGVQVLSNGRITCFLI